MPGDGTVKFATTDPPLSTSELDQEQAAIQALGEENWIGLLQRKSNNSASFLSLTQHLVFCDAPPRRKPRYEEIIVGKGVPRFQYTLAIDGFPEKFGCICTFTSKKLAKQYVSKQAVKWLISNKHMPSDGIVKPTKTKPTTPPLQPKVVSSTSEKHTELVPKLAVRLGLQCPSYILTPASDAPGCPLWDGYAEFAEKQSIGDEGKLGHVRNVFGKNNAKQEIAKNVHAFLKGIEAHRLSIYEEEDKKRK